MKLSAARYCVFNKTRKSFLALDVMSADTHLSRLKGLLGTLRLKSDEGIWIIPSQGIHTVGLRFAIDLIYLDEDYRVIETVESLGKFRIGPIRMKSASVLELPTRTIYASQTQVGDELLICLPQEIELKLKNVPSEHSLSERNDTRGMDDERKDEDATSKCASAEC